MHLGEQRAHARRFSSPLVPFSASSSDDSVPHPQLLHGGQVGFSEACMHGSFHISELQSPSPYGVTTTTWT